MSILSPKTLAEVTEVYNVKIKEMGTYLEVIYYSENISRIKSGYELRDDFVDDNFCSKEDRDFTGIIRADNLYRTRNNMVDLVKTNEDNFHSFVTLTYRDDVSYEQANKLFSNYVRQIKRHDHDFKYLAVIEYHKNRDVIHFHMMSSLVPDSDLLPKRKKKRLWNPNVKSSVSFEYYDLPYWNYGFSQAYDLSVTDENFSPSLYMTKYLFKDADKRYFGKNKIRYSRNLDRPKEKVLETDTNEFQELLNEFNKKYKLNDTRQVIPTRIHGMAFTVQSYTLK